MSLCLTGLRESIAGVAIKLASPVAVHAPRCKCWAASSHPRRTLCALGRSLGVVKGLGNPLRSRREGGGLVHSAGAE
jgi:hypothetical protein